MYSMVLMVALSGSVEVPDCHRRSCGCYGGCKGGCYGGGYGGCHGGGYGGCYGGGYGGCYGGATYGCYGGYGSGCYGGSGYGCYGGSGYGCYGGYGSGCYGSGGAMHGVTYGGGGYGTTTPTKEGKEESYHRAAPATIVVELPAEAKLLIDGQPTTSGSSQRVFVSPDLDSSRDYHYTLKAEAVRDGKPVVVEKRVTVRGGQTTPVRLTFPEGQVAQR
jgi:uncharacterized protein (TIGR03000 family)